MGQVEAARTLRRLVALAMAFLLMLMGQGELLAQQLAYVPGPPSGYAQPVYTQPYNQPVYAPQPYTSYPQQTYPNAYPSQPYQQQYAAPVQRNPQQGSQLGYGSLQPATQGLNAQQLEQLAAPIALYPDTLVAQILAAATYPGQVVEADRWRRAQGNARSDQIALGADVQSWDPSVKGLTAFPQVLAEMDQTRVDDGARRRLLQSAAGFAGVRSGVAAAC